MEGAYSVYARYMCAVLITSLYILCRMQMQGLMAGAIAKPVDDDVRIYGVLSEQYKSDCLQETDQCFPNGRSVIVH